MYTINDLDIVVLCRALSYPGAPGIGATSWTRDDIFRVIAAPLLADGRYRAKVHYSATSMCIKVNLGIKVELLPVVPLAGVTNVIGEPFTLFRPETRLWEPGFAKLHQQRLTEKNTRTGENFIPAIKVLKHLRSQAGDKTASFHIECLLHSLPDHLFSGAPADFIPSILAHVGAMNPYHRWAERVRTPCGDRHLYSKVEWGLSEWVQFHSLVKRGAILARAAVTESDRVISLTLWQRLLGDRFFPTEAG